MIKHFAIRETCIAGRTIERIIKMPSGNHKGNRGRRTNATEEAVRKNNDIIAERNLRRKINHNFGKGSAHYTLTYGEYLPTPQEAKKDLKNFIRRMRTALGKSIKWVAVTEYNNHRIHHHIIINTVNAELVNEKWGKGWVRTSLLDNSGDYKKLPVMLVSDYISVKQAAFLEKLSDDTEYIIIGGTSAVSQIVSKQITDISQVTRIDGADRYETSTMIAEYFYPSAEAVILVNAWADAIAACNIGEYPVILLSNHTNESAREYIKKHGIKTAYVIGNITDDTLADIFN